MKTSRERHSAMLFMLWFFKKMHIRLLLKFIRNELHFLRRHHLVTEISARYRVITSSLKADRKRRAIKTRGGSGCEDNLSSESLVLSPWTSTREGLMHGTCGHLLLFIVVLVRRNKPQRTKASPCNVTCQSHTSVWVCYFPILWTSEKWGCYHRFHMGRLDIHEYCICMLDQAHKSQLQF